MRQSQSTSRNCCTIFSALLVIATHSAFAADPIESDKCSSIGDATKRLACYDAAGRNRAKPSTMPPEKGEVGQGRANKTAQDNADTANAALVAKDKLVLAENAQNRNDYATALRIYRELGEQGNADAQNSIANMYSNGLGVPKNPAEALAWKRKAVDQGHVIATADFLAETNPTALVAFLRSRAEKGDADAQKILGEVYLLGVGVPADRNEGMTWLRKAASQGNPESQNTVGYYLASGIANIPKNPTEAFSWYLKAAEQGHASSQASVGTAYLNGSGVAKDRDEAMKWLSRAVAQGDESVIRRVKLSLALNQLTQAAAQRSKFGWAIGMTKNQVLQNSGRTPDRMNKFTTGLGTREQWVYGNGYAYLYFDEQGTLVSFQEREIP